MMAKTTPVKVKNTYGRGRSGPPSLFPGKDRNTVITFTLPPRLLTVLNEGAARLAITRSDFIALLIHRYGRTVQIPSKLPTVDDSDE
jgi:hypothetical protein